MGFLRLSSAKVERIVPLLFRCAACGHRAMADVRAEGYGEGVGVAVIGDQGAGRAHEAAVVSASEHARTLSSLAACPACHRRDRGAVARFVVWGGLGALLPALVVGALLLGLVAALHTPTPRDPRREPPRTGPPAWVGPGLMLALPGALALLTYGYFARVHWGWSADGRITFRPPKEAPPAAPPPRRGRRAARDPEAL